jgi:TolB-like protein/DNA-binding winged helix-turn-helix (wHTH) protein/Flp pilus assembly protein TadD
MPAQANAYRFGPYELRVRTRELYKNDIKLKLRPQPFRLIQLLIERQADVVTREELRELLWSAETFVDFEQGLNTAVKELRGVLSDSAESPRYIATVPRVGYRMIAPVQPVFPEDPRELKPETKSSSPETIATKASSDGRNWSLLPSLRWPAAAGVVLLLLLGAVGYWQWSRKHVEAKQPTERVMLAVMPFENLTGEAGQDYLSDGLTEEMISQLGHIDRQRLGVIARTSVMHYKDNPAPLDRVGRELGVQYVLEGSVRRDADTVRVSAQLIEVKDQTHLWSRQYDRHLPGLLALQSEIAREIADEIQLTFGDKHPATLGSSPAASSYEAYDLYLRGRYFWNKRTESGFYQAADYFQQAIDKDPNYAKAYAGLADALTLLSDWGYVPAPEFIPRARAAALKALQIDASQAEAHASLALIAEQYDYDWQTAETEFQRAIQLDPDYATAHQWYAECLSLEGRFDEALAESERARQLDPLSLIIATDHAVILYFDRQYDRAIEQFSSVREMDPQFPRSSIIFNAYVEKGDFADALTVLEEDNRRSHTENTAGFFSDEAYVYGRSGRLAEARRAFTKCQELRRLHPSLEADQAWIELHALMGIGRSKDVIAVLQKDSVEHPSALVSLKVDPFYDPLRGDPQFQDLLRRAHLADNSPVSPKSVTRSF